MRYRCAIHDQVFDTRNDHSEPGSDKNHPVSKTGHIGHPDCRGCKDDLLASDPKHQERVKRTAEAKRKAKADFDRAVADADAKAQAESDANAAQSDHTNETDAQRVEREYNDSVAAIDAAQV